MVEDITYPNSHIIPALSTTTFHYTRAQGEFGAVMCYYYVDLAARRILQSGYSIPNGLKNLRIDPHGFGGVQNATYNSVGNYIDMGSRYGVGNDFVPSSEDADVILHEYGHAMQHNLGAGMPPNNTSVREGCSDYWATSYKRSIYPNNWAVFGAWHNEGDTSFIRRTDLNWVYNPSNPIQGHIEGQVLSSALMKVWGDLGRDVTDKIFLEMHYIWGQTTDMQDAATAFIQADLHLYNGRNVCQIYSRFQQHGLIDPSQIIMTTNFVNQTVTGNKIVFSCTDLNVQNVNVQSGAKLILEASGSITIQGDFDVQPGASFEVNIPSP